MRRREPRRSTGCGRHLLAAVLASLLCAAAGGDRPVAAAAGPPSEHQVKAEYLIRFLAYIDWPAGTFPNGEAPIHVGVLGNDPFGKGLDDLAAATVVRRKGANRKVVVKRGNQLEDLKDCQVLFLAWAEAARVPQVLAAVGNQGVLTISETEAFAERGGIINFVIVKKRVLFEINQETAQGRGFKIDPELLDLAIIVKPKKR